MTIGADPTRRFEAHVARMHPFGAYIDLIFSKQSGGGAACTAAAATNCKYHTSDFDNKLRVDVEVCRHLRSLVFLQAVP